MDRGMIAIVLVSVYVVLYHAAPLVGAPDEFMLFLFAISPLCVVYVVYMVLRFGKPSSHTFDERFYDDWDYQRNGKEEIS